MSAIRQISPEEAKAALTAGRALLAAIEKGETVKDFCARTGMASALAFRVKTVLQGATPAEIAGVLDGSLALNSLAKLISKGMDAAQRQAWRQTPETDRGGHRHRKEQAAANAVVWGDLRTALEKLTGLPRASDVAAVAHNGSQTRAITDNRLPTALKWLTDFADAYGELTNARN